MRGKGLCKGFHLCDVGITPAYAGKSYRYAAQQRAGRDHPRVCGEKKNRLERGGEKAGSPPRMRGKDALADKEV